MWGIRISGIYIYKVNKVFRLNNTPDKNIDTIKYVLNEFMPIINYVGTSLKNIMYLPNYIK